MSDCIEWTRAKTKGGYGLIWNEKKLKYIHRLTYENAHNVTLKRTDYVCHSCDNPSCYNIEHLFLGNAEVNNKDREKKNRTAVGYSLPHTRLSEQDVFDIIELRKNGEKTVDIAKRYDIDQSHVSKICLRQTRKALG